MKTMTWQRISAAVCLALCTAAGTQTLWAEDASVKITSSEHDLNGDRFVAGCPVSVTTPVKGDLIATGCDVQVTAEIDGDLVVLGGNLHLAAPVKQNLYAAGGEVSIDADVQRNMRVAGGRVEVGPNAKIGGNVTVGGGEVKIEGAIGGYLQVGGGNVRINGPVAGDVEVGAGDLELGPNARIEGKLRYASGDAFVRDADAKVRGGVEKIEHADDDDEHWNFAWHPWQPGQQWQPWHGREHSGHGWTWYIGMLAIAAILAAVAPHFYAQAAQTAHTRWPLSLVIGFLVLACVPVASLLAILTLIGIPLALLMIALYLVLLLVGYVSAGIVLGEVVLQRWRADLAAHPGWRVGAAVLAMAVLCLLGRVPLFGWMVTLAAVITGMGVVLMQLRSPPAVSGTYQA
jgi:hypothetical protein